MRPGGGVAGGSGCVGGDPEVIEPSLVRLATDGGTEGRTWSQPRKRPGGCRCRHRRARKRCFRPRLRSHRRPSCHRRRWSSKVASAAARRTRRRIWLMPRLTLAVAFASPPAAEAPAVIGDRAAVVHRARWPRPRRRRTTWCRSPRRWCGSSPRSRRRSRSRSRILVNADTDMRDGQSHSRNWTRRRCRGRQQSPCACADRDRTGVGQRHVRDRRAIFERQRLRSG